MAESEPDLLLPVVALQHMHLAATGAQRVPTPVAWRVAPFVAPIAGGGS